MPDEENRRPYHVYPVKDLEPHVTYGTTCPCHPRIEEEGLLIVHRAFDHREVVEEAVRIVNPPKD